MGNSSAVSARRATKVNMSKHERIIAVEGLQNFRDIGGYLTEDGCRVVMYKHLYRSDNIACATAGGLKVLTEKLKVKYFIDFRSSEETRSSPYNIPGIIYCRLPISACNMVDSVRKQATLDGPMAIELLRLTAKTFLIDFKVEYKNFFRFLLDEVKGKPAVFHCTAGKDRTGVAAALLLALLNVPYKTVQEDFMLTNKCIIPPDCDSVMVGTCVIQKEAIYELSRAHLFFLDLAFDGAIAQYGSIKGYAKGALDLTEKDIEMLQSLYTRPVSGSRLS